MFEQEAFGRVQVFTQNGIDDLEMLTQSQFAILDRVERADELELDNEVDERGTFFEERIARGFEEKPVASQIGPQDILDGGPSQSDKFSALVPVDLESVPLLLGKSFCEKRSQGKNLDHLAELAHLPDALIAEKRYLPLPALPFGKQPKRRHFQKGLSDGNRRDSNLLCERQFGELVSGAKSPAAQFGKEKILRSLAFRALFGRWQFGDWSHKSPAVVRALDDFGPSQGGKKASDDRATHAT